MAENEEKQIKKTKSQAPQEFKKLVDELDKMSVLQISKFVKFLEEHWGVTASAPAVAMPAPAAIMAMNVAGSSHTLRPPPCAAHIPTATIASR